MPKKQRKKNKEGKTSSLEIYQEAFKNSPNSMVLVEYKNKKPKIVNINKAFTEYYGYSKNEAIGKNPSLLKSGTQKKDYYEKMWKDLLDPKIGGWEDEIVNKRKDNSLINVALTITTIFEDDKPKAFIASHVDISNLKEKIEELEGLNNLMIGRELKMVELENEVKKLKERK